LQNRFLKSVLLLLVLFKPLYGAKDRCADITARLATGEKAASGPSRSGITADELNQHVTKAITQVPEFEYIAEEAKKMGLRVWLFGGTASSFLHYAKWDLARQKGLMPLQADRFDYDFTNIFRSTQDLDIVIDATPEKAREFQNKIAQRYPHFLGSKAAKWEVRTLKHRMGSPGQPGFKEALLNDADFNNQNTDSNSVGMVELTKNKEPAIRDLRHWDGGESKFFDDALNNRISFFRSDKHFTTSRAKGGENPEVLSVIRLLVKAFQYELEFSKEDFAKMKEVVDEFDPRKVNNSNAVRRIQDTAKKLVQHAVNIEYALNTLDQLGLRQKLIQMGNKSEHDNQAWWLNKEPLRSRPVGEGKGKTAEDLNIKVVAHETNNFLAYESITRAHSGEPNVLISRQNAVGEAAAYGDGFYSRLGKEGARGTGLTIRFKVDPNAREGTDFTVHGDYVVFKNRKALKVIQESLNFGLDDLLKLAEENKDVAVDHSDLALLEKLKRRLNAARITDELEKLLHSNKKEDHDRLIHILSSFQNSTIEKLISKDVLGAVAKSVFNQVSHLSQSSKEKDILQYIKTVGPILKTLDSNGALKTKDFVAYLNKLIHSESDFSLRKEAVFEKLLSSDDFQEHLNFKKDLKESEITEVVSEIKDWHKAQDNRYKKFAIELDKRWGKGIENGDIKALQALADSRLFDVNRKNISGFSALLTADYYGQKKVIDWLIQNPEFDFNQRNEHGYTEVEQLRLLGKDKLADEIEKQRREVRARRKLKEVETSIVATNTAKEAPKPAVPVEESKSKTIQVQGGKNVVQLLPNGKFQDLGFRPPPDGITYKEGFIDGDGNIIVLLGGTGKGFNIKLRDGPVIISKLQQWENGINPEVTEIVPNLNGSGFTALDKEGRLYSIELPTRQKREFTARLIDKGPFSRLFQHGDGNFAEKNEGTGVVEIRDKEGTLPKLVKAEKERLPAKEVAVEEKPEKQNGTPKELKALPKDFIEEKPKERIFAEVKERNVDGSPIVDFVRFEPGSFLMGDGDNKVLTTITKPFEMLSTPTTQKAYKEVVGLLKKQSAQKYKDLNAEPSHFKGEQNPVEQVSYSDIELWNQGLNELSKSDDVKIQKALETLFPGHKKGNVYRLPTEAEWEYVARNAGLAEGNYSFGNSENGLSDHAWYSQNAGSKTHPVGEKKPVLYNGKPIYDLHGNVWVWIQDWYGNNISGGTDPQGPPSGSNRVLRGGGWSYAAQDLRSAARYAFGPAYRNGAFGFRLVRTP